MFEKEVKERYPDCWGKSSEYAPIWKDGAEYGYNKCKEELEDTLENAKEVIEYLLTSLRIEGCDLSESGCKTKDYEIYHKAISFIEDKEVEK